MKEVAAETYTHQHELVPTFLHTGTICSHADPGTYVYRTEENIMRGFTRPTPICLLLVVLTLVMSACGGPPAASTASAPATVASGTAAPSAASETSAAPAPSTAASETAAAPASSAAPSTASAAAPVASLRVAILRDESLLQPYAYVTGYPGWNMLSLLYDSLFVMNAQNVPVPWLATEDLVSGEGITHTLTLRENVQWHDGTPLTSADVKFAYEYYQTNTHSRWTSQVNDITSIETPDAQTVVITLAQPNPSFAIQPLADVPIIPKHVWENVTEPDTFANNVGSGPYKLAEYRPDQLYRFEANAEHFAGAPAAAEIIMPVIKDQTTIFSALRTGEIHATTVALAPELVQEFKSVPTLKVQTGPGYATTMLQFNTERAPWDNLDVRRAVSLAIDPKQLVDTVLLGLGTPGNPGWLHPSSPFHDPAITATYDVAQATTLLDNLGYRDTDGDGVREANGNPMRADLLVQANNPLRVRTAELIVAALKPIGIELNVVAMEPDSLTAKVWPEFDVSKGRDFDLSMWGWSAPLQVDPVRMASLVHSDPAIGTSNIGGFRNDEADQIANELTTAVGQEAQTQLARQMEAFIADQLPFVMLYYADGNYVYQPQVYDGWIYQTGQGIFHKLSFQPTAVPQ